VINVILKPIYVILFLDAVIIIPNVERILALFAPITIVLLILPAVLRMLNVVLAKFAILPTYVKQRLLPVAVLKIPIVEPVLVVLPLAMVPNIVLLLPTAVCPVSLVPLVKFAKNAMVLLINVKIFLDVVVSMLIALVVKSAPISLVKLILLYIVVQMIATVPLPNKRPRRSRIIMPPLVLIIVTLPKVCVKLTAILVSITLV